MTKYVTGLVELIDKYDGFIIDLMGVVHNGACLFPNVISCLNALKKNDKMVIFLSNAPRRSYTTKARLDKFKLPDHLYDQIITSGESLHHSLKTRETKWLQDLGLRAYHIGQNKDNSLFDDNVCEKVDSLEEADFILNSDIAHRGETPATYEDVLQRGRQLDLPMVCANPDLVVQIQDTIEYCAGAIAKRYEELGGDVSYFGKPYPTVYEWVKAAFPKGARLLAIGDAFETDIKGAQNANIDSALVGCGIHFRDLNVTYGELPEPSLVQALADRYDALPTYVLPGLIFYPNTDTEG